MPNKIQNERAFVTITDNVNQTASNANIKEENLFSDDTTDEADEEDDELEAELFIKASEKNVNSKRFHQQTKQTSLGQQAPELNSDEYESTTSFVHRESVTNIYHNQSGNDNCIDNGNGNGTGNINNNSVNSNKNSDLLQFNPVQALHTNVDNLFHLNSLADINVNYQLTANGNNVRIIDNNNDKNNSHTSLPGIGKEKQFKKR